MVRSVSRRFRVTLHLAAGVCVAAVGCAQHDKGTPPPATQPVTMVIPSTVYDFVEVQSANGAAADATLYRAHFDGDRLNSLGRAKLALIARAYESGQHVTIYVDTPQNIDTPAKRDAISAYLAHAGIASGDFDIKPGANPDNYAPAAAAIQGLRKTDSDYQSQQSDESMSGSRGGYGSSGGYGGGSGGSAPSK